MYKGCLCIHQHTEVYNCATDRTDGTGREVFYALNTQAHMATRDNGVSLWLIDANDTKILLLCVSLMI